MALRQATSVRNGTNRRRVVRPVRQASLAAQTEQIIRDRLVEGDLAPGDQLPPEHELASELAVSRATVRAAITGLVRRGLVVQRHGIGNFVAVGSRLTNNLSEAIDLNELLRRGGSVARVEFANVVVTPATATVAAALDLGKNDLVLRSEKQFIVDDAPMIYVVNSIPISTLGAELADRAVLDPHLTEPMFEFLEAAAGVSTSTQLAELYPELGSQIEHPAAHLDAGTPVLRIDEVGYTSTNTPIWHSTSWYPPSSMSFQLIRHRTGVLT